MSDKFSDSTGRAPRGTLFVVATPIGNLQDLSPRASACLRDADLLLAEDTRHTRKLLDACGIAREGSFESLHEHNERERVPALLDRLRAGATIALVTDAGTPLMSDPGALRAALSADVESSRSSASVASTNASSARSSGSRTRLRTLLASFAASSVSPAARYSLAASSASRGSKARKPRRAACS